MTTVVGRNILKLLSFSSAAKTKIGELLLNFQLYLSNKGLAPAPPPQKKHKKWRIVSKPFGFHCRKNLKSLSICDFVQERHVDYRNSSSRGVPRGDAQDARAYPPPLCIPPTPVQPPTPVHPPLPILKGWL